MDTPTPLSQAERTELITSAVERFRSEARRLADTILVCDDERGIRNLAARSIRRDTKDLCLNVLEFESAEDALAHLENADNEERVLAIVSDRNMRGVTGEEFALGLRERGDEVSPFVIATSDVADEVRGALASGAIDGLLEKPYDPAVLVPTVALAMAKRLDMVKRAAGEE